MHLVFCFGNAFSFLHGALLCMHGVRSAVWHCHWAARIGDCRLEKLSEKKLAMKLDHLKGLLFVTPLDSMLEN